MKKRIMYNNYHRYINFQVNVIQFILWSENKKTKTQKYKENSITYFMNSWVKFLYPDLSSHSFPLTPTNPYW